MVELVLVYICTLSLSYLLAYRLFLIFTVLLKNRCVCDLGNFVHVRCRDVEKGGWTCSVWVVLVNYVSVLALLGFFS